MFSDEDVRELIQLLPTKDATTLLPSLVFSSSGRGLLTLQHLEHEFESQVTKGRVRLIIDIIHSQQSQAPNEYLCQTWLEFWMWTSTQCFNLSKRTQRLFF
jgi:hypothetical protein